MIAAENYEALKAMMEKQARRTTVPVRKSNKAMLVPEAAGPKVKPPPKQAWQEQAADQAHQADQRDQADQGYQSNDVDLLEVNAEDMLWTGVQRDRIESIDILRDS